MMDTYVLKHHKAVCTTVMHSKGYNARLMRAPRLQDTGKPNRLPPGEPIPVIPLSVLPGAPESWVREPGSYVCPVSPDWGLWFDWTCNDHLNTAVVASVKGMNPITGQKIEDVRLHRYVEKCPVHDCNFIEEPGLHVPRLCPKCEYRWPPQNYVCAPNVLWWDGFRQPDGTVRQFFFSEDEARDIASLVMGKENVVPAFGFVFYETSKRFESHDGVTVLFDEHYGDEGPDCDNFLDFSPAVWSGSWSGSSSSSSSPSAKTLSSAKKFTKSQEIGPPITSAQFGPTGPIGPTGPRGPSGTPSLSRSLSEERTCGLSFSTCESRGQLTECAGPPAVYKDVAVGAGAEIWQDLCMDPKQLSDWKPDPAAMIRLYFVFELQLQQIMAKGVVELRDKERGFLDGLPVG